MTTKTTTIPKTRKFDFAGDETVRHGFASVSTFGFFTTCLSHYIELPTADFHVELADALDDPTVPLLEVIGQRDSAKSTFATLAFPLRVALSGQFRFIVIINDTTEQVKITIDNIRHEIENNIILKQTFGVVKIGKTWSETNLLLSNGVRIIGRSRGQNIRGIRHRQHRPDLIIVDDPENLKQVKKKKNRDATETWFNGEVLPAQRSFGAKLVVIGNLLHNDSFIARLKKNSLFKVVEFPIIDARGVPLWLAKYPTRKALINLRKRVGNTAYSREYLLKPVAEQDQVVKESDIQYYPNKILTHRNDRGQPEVKIMDAGVGVDLAISELETADFTAMVPGLKVEWNGRHVLVKPGPVNKRMNFDATIKQAKATASTLPLGTRFYVEDVGYQRAAIQQMRKHSLVVSGMKPVSDKRARLQSIAPWILDGTVLFPETGCEDLINAIVNLGVEEHDDLVDAFVYMVMGLLMQGTTASMEKVDRL